VSALVLPPGEFKAYLFDLDGTIANSMPLHYLGWKQAVEEHGGQFPEDLFYAWAGTPLPRTVEMLNERFGLTMPVMEVVHRKESLYLSRLSDLEPVAAVLHHIHESHGTIPFAIVSGSPRASIVGTLTQLGLLELFPVLVGAEDYTRGKPDPEPFLTAAAQLGVDPADCLVFEDAETGIAAAKAAGMQWVKVPTRY
jgi:HAD superfamily hydrolase (TIGR01509 family)